MNKNDLEIRIHETQGQVEWEVSEVLSRGISTLLSDAVERANKELERFQRVAAAPVNSVAPDTDPEVVPVQLTKEERRQLYTIVYGAMRGANAAYQLEEVETKRYHELLAKLSD